MEGAAVAQVAEAYGKPWIVVRANDKRRARLAVIQRILLSLPYDGRDESVIGKEDRKIIGEGPALLGS